MSKPSFLTESFGGKSLSIVVASLLLLVIVVVCEVAPAQENGAADRREAFRRIVQSYIKTGKDQYQERYFAQAEKTFLMAEKHREYLTVAGREELSGLLEKTRTAAAKRKLALDTFRTVRTSIKQDQLTEAKAGLQSLMGSEFLTKDEQVQIAEVLKQVDAQIIDNEAHSEKVEGRKRLAADKLAEIAAGLEKTDQQKKAQNENIAEIYRTSMDLYRAGKLKEAREGFVKVAASEVIPPPMKKTLQDYIARIDKVLPAKVRQTAPEEDGTLVASVEPKVIEPEVPQPTLASPKLTAPESDDANGGGSEAAAPGFVQPQAPEVAAAASSEAPAAGGDSYIDQVTRKRNIIRTYTGTVVNDAVAKARGYIEKGDFENAKRTVDSAAFTVNDNQIHLGDALFTEYSGKLKALADEIAAEEGERTRQDAQAKREAAIEANRQFRDQMESDRQKRIAELMENAITYENQQRYEAALGQLETLLALDPQNDQALTMKDRLEDNIYFRRQLEVQKESDRQKADVLLKTEESQIPYADEITYPKNWREIINKPTRQPDKPIGLDPVDAAVYEQLEQLVDLSDLNTGMSFSDVITRLKEAVDPPLQVQPNWKDLLENADLEPTSPAGMDPLTGVKLRKVLEVLLAGVSSDFAQVSYVVDEGVIVIATVEALPAKLVTRVYDISDLVSEPAQYGGLQGLMMGYSLSQSMSGQSTTGGGGLGGGGGGLGGGGFGGGGLGGGLGGGGFGGGGLGGGLGGGMMGGMGGGMMGGMGGGGMMGGMMGGGMGGMIQAQSLVQLVQESIEPESWFDLSDTGEGTVTPYPLQQPKKLAVYNTHEVHEEVEKLLASLRLALGYQVSIEARFLVVSENFLEDIGLDVDFSFNLGSNWGQLTLDQDSALITKGEATQVPTSLGGIGAAGSISGGYGSILDDLQVAFLLRATQAHRDSKALTAPIASVLSGESATFNIQRQFYLALPPIQGGGVTTTGAATGTTTNTGTTSVPQYLQVPSGSNLSITPVITHDKKNVLLNIITLQTDFLGIRASKLEYPAVTGGTGGAAQVVEYDVQLPETETSSLMTRVSVPDGGTLLLGGQKITTTVDKEAGVPVLSKIPVLGRLFSNRSTVRDQKILLILVKPTIILQEEREAEAIAAMEKEL